MATTQATFQELKHAGLDEVDPEIARLLGDELERQRGQIELIASENFTWPAVLEAVGSVRDEQVRRGLSRPPLLRRLRGDRRDRAARDRPREGAVRRRARERPAARGRADEHGRLRGRDGAGRHADGARAQPGRPPHARPQGQLLGPPLQRRALRGLARDDDRRLRRRAREGEGGAAEGDRLRRLRLSAHGRDRPLPRDRRRGRRAAPLRHGPLRRARRRRPPAESGRALRLRHLDDAQDARRPARRLHPLPRGACEGARLGRDAGDAGRPARAHDRGEGDVLPDRDDRRVPRVPGAGPPQRRRARRDAARGRALARHGRHRHAPPARRPDASRSGRARRRRSGCTRSTSPSTATRSRSTSARRSSPRESGSARRR